MAAYEGVELANPPFPWNSYMPFTVGMRMFIVFMVFVRISLSRRISHVFRSFRVGFLLILHDPPILPWRFYMLGAPPVINPFFGEFSNIFHSKYSKPSMNRGNYHHHSSMKGFPFYTFLSFFRKVPPFQFSIHFLGDFPNLSYPSAGIFRSQRFLHPQMLRDVQPHSPLDGHRCSPGHGRSCMLCHLDHGRARQSCGADVRADVG